MKEISLIEFTVACLAPANNFLIIFVALLSFFCALASAVSVETIAERIKEKKLALEKGVAQAAISLEKYGTLRLRSLEELSSDLISRKKNLREKSYAVEYARALASFALKNEKRIKAYKDEMPNSALLFNATYSIEGDFPHYKNALKLLVGMLKNKFSRQNFILESASSVELSSFILPKDLIFFLGLFGFFNRHAF